MKTALLFFSVLFGLQLSSQDWNVASHNLVNQPLSVVCINSKSYYLERQGADCCGNYMVVKSIAESGQSLLVLSHSIPNSNSQSAESYPVKMIRSLDKGLVCIGNSQQQLCDGDVLNDFVQNHLIKLDTNGLIKFDVPVQTGVINSETITDIAQHPDSSYYLVTNAQVFHYSKTGQLLGTNGFNVSNIKSVTALSNGYLLFNATVGGNHENTIVGTNGVVLNQNSASSDIIKFIRSGSSFYGLSSTGALEKYDSTLTLQYTSTLTSGGFRFNDFTVRNDSIFAAGTVTASVNPRYCILSQSLSTLYQGTSPYSNVLPVGIAIDSKNRVHLLTKGSSSNTDLPFSSLYRFPLTSMFHSHSDVGVQSIVITSPVIIPENFIGSISPAYLDFAVAVTVKNYGADTIHTFYLNHTTDLGLCHTYQSVYYQTIPPGGTVGLGVQHVIGNSVNVHLNTPPGIVINHQECFFTTVPNASGDAEISNDQACAQVVIVTGIKTNTLPDAELRVFPNPFDNSLTVNSDAEIRQVELYDVIGKLQLRREADARSIQLSGLDLPPGIYFMKLVTEKGIATRKLVRD